MEKMEKMEKMERLDGKTWENPMVSGCFWQKYLGKSHGFMMFNPWFMMFMDLKWIRTSLNIPMMFLVEKHVSTILFLVISQPSTSKPMGET